MKSNNKIKSLLLLKYVGSKSRFVDLINREISKANCDIYIEPFLGSGAVFFNLEREYKLKIINDIDRNIIRIFNSFKELESFEYLENFYNSLNNKYGNWGRDKEVYYKFRNEMNAKYFKSNSIEEGLFFYFVSRSCINSLIRFGPNGFNQGWGNRGYDINIDNSKYIKIKNCLRNTEIRNMSFFDFMQNEEMIEDDNILFFLDPPYFSLSQMYNKKNFQDLLKNKDEFYRIIKKIKGKVIYTNLYEEEIDKKLKWRTVDIRNLRSIRPHESAGKVRGREVMYCNF